MSSFHVRPFRIEDAFAVARLEALCNPLPWHVEDLLPFDSAQDTPPSSYVRVGLVIEEERRGISGATLGYVFAGMVAGEAEILILGVHPDARRKGLAKRLLEDLFAHLRTLSDPFVAESVFLEVRRGNEAAIRLYESMGFTRTGARKGYYADNGEDALLLRREVRG
jgi:ribosomal-protein-alanine N-acetyltransferase